MIGRNGDVALLEEPVKIGPQKDPVGHSMRTVGHVRSDVRSFERGQRMLACNRAGPTVCLCHSNPEGSLDEPQHHKNGGAIPRSTRLASSVSKTGPSAVETRRDG